MMRWLLAIAVLGCACGTREAVDELEKSKRNLARVQTAKLAAEWYPRWALAHPDKACPDGLDEVAKHIGMEPMRDPWERPFVMVCGAAAPPAAKGFGVVSLGKDGQQDTPDDVRSWEP